MQEQTNRIFCIARFDENLDWISTLKGSVIIYNKSNSFEYQYPRHDIPNFGRETETFLRFILQYYNQLKDYNSVVFLQGNPFSHCKDVIEKLSNIDDLSFQFLSDITAKSTFPESDNFGIHLSTMCRLFDVEYDWDIEKFSKSDNDSNSLLSGIRHMEHCLSACFYCGIDTKGISYEWAPGCQYQVPVEMILNKPLQWWLNIHNMHVYFSRVKKTDFFSYVMETIWPLLISHKL